MPAIPETPQQKITNAQAAEADQQARFTMAKLAQGVSDRERLRLSGYSDDEIEAMEEEIAGQSELPDEEDGDEVE